MRYQIIRIKIIKRANTAIYMNSMANNKNECPLDSTGDCCTRAGPAALPSCSASSLSGPPSYLSY